MKKTMILIALVAAVAFAAGYAGLAFAQGPQATPVADSAAFGGRGGMMGGRGGMGQMGANGALQPYMQAEMAAAFGLTTDELTALHTEGQTLWDVAQEQSLSAEEFQAKISAARSAALEKAVADGVITQEQADWMSQRMGQHAGSGECTGMTGGQHGRGGRGQQAPAVTP